MPPTNVVQMLVPPRAVTESDWYQLVEARRAAIAPHLDSFTLGKLADVECLKAEGGLHAIDSRTEFDSRSEFAADTQGIFGYEGQSKCFFGTGEQVANRVYRDGSCNVWGLTRRGEWLVAKVTFRGAAGWTQLGAEYATSLEVKTVSLYTMCFEALVTPQKVWETLGGAVQAWAAHRHGLYMVAQGLASRIDVENLILETATSQPN